ncbi:hypothetical protein Slin15195_G096860 [Septoria linicola]|uniref:Hydrophobin n=1 Tax=Septoria linicola TaxID=215465 RepID=A0A9Q9B2S8_9PEZI|nr:hypothetical protein Slin14017_G059950 [Septoria linicola]USW56367.1 hypothetical protein Slin15195_G096860 [Septoria linicola]
MQFTIATILGLAALAVAAPAPAANAAVVARGGGYGGGQGGQGGIGGNYNGNFGGGQGGGQGGGFGGGQGGGFGGGMGGGYGQVSCPKGQRSGCYPGEPRGGDTYNDVDVYSSCSDNKQAGLIPVSLCDNLNGNTVAIPVSLELLNL